MSYLKTLNPEEHPESLGDTNKTMMDMFGKVPSVFEAMNLRPELLDPVLTLPCGR